MNHSRKQADIKYYNLNKNFLISKRPFHGHQLKTAYFLFCCRIKSILHKLKQGKLKQKKKKERHT